MTTKQLKRLEMLGFYISKYSDLWGNSPRLFNWVDEYNTIKSEMTRENWEDYCNKWGYSTNHNGYDCLA